MDRKAVIAAVAGVLITLAVTLLWDLVASGAESTVASNPKITALESQITELEDELTQYREETADVHARQDERLKSLVKGQDRILDILIGDD